LADRYRKTLVSLVLMLLGIIANSTIYFSHQLNTGDMLILIAFLVAGGAAACMYPLSLTHLYDYIEIDDALSWVAAIQLIYGVGSILGPVCLGFMMGAGGLIM
ncbi:MAG: MFS transporter, partial [Gammaproteobacteria bacterium]|nr:MFS transporter [Gammaproteobacteria bacterium]NIO63363.1 MFS transporter [Gammaproteobacteria bacterium]